MSSQSSSFNGLNALQTEARVNVRLCFQAGAGSFPPLCSSKRTTSDESAWNWEMNEQVCGSCSVSDRPWWRQRGWHGGFLTCFAWISHWAGASGISGWSGAEKDFGDCRVILQVLLQGPTPSVSKDVKDEDSALRLFILCRLSPLKFSFLCWPLRRMKFIYLVLFFAVVFVLLRMWLD